MPARPPIPGMWAAAERSRSNIPRSSIDFAWRSEHEMTVKAKAVIQAFYGRGPRLSYWNGCSTGGRQGLKEAQKFPDDYDAHHRRRAGQPDGHLAVDRRRGAEGSGQLYPAQQVSDHPPGRARRLRRARRAEGRPHRRSRPNARSIPAVLLCKGADGPGVPHRRRRWKRRSRSIRPPSTRARARKCLRRSCRERSWAGAFRPGSGTVGQYLRPVSLRRVQGSELGLEDVQLRQGRGAGRPAGKPDHERHRSGHAAVLLARRQAAALSRLERLRRCRPSTPSSITTAS